MLAIKMHTEMFKILTIVRLYQIRPLETLAVAMAVYLSSP